MDVRRNTSATCSPRGFTLIEMLVVVVIIGILAGLVSVAAIRARGTARVAEIRMEIATLEQGLEAFKSKYGDYPPDFTDTAAVKRFIARAWPRYTGNWENESEIVAGVRNPSAAICFWLGGLRGEGFNSNPRTPFLYNSGSMTGPFFDFKTDRVKGLSFSETAPLAYYYQPNATADTHPYVYFRAGSNGYLYDSKPKEWTAPDGTTVKACYDLGGKWAKPKSYQIRAPGMDGIHGTGVDYPEGSDYSEQQYDDISNFSDGTFEDSMP
jgi:prepilin-type N-terminal cleavage/methylation domain-containing protein